MQAHLVALDVLRQRVEGRFVHLQFGLYLFNRRGEFAPFGLQLGGFAAAA
jgi:hypothetical protein